MFEPDAKLVARELSVGYAADQVISKLNLSFQRGSITVIVGPNGAGKSSLLKALARKLQLAGGTVLLDGHNILTLSHSELDSKVSLLTQQARVTPKETIFEFVSKSAMNREGIGRVSPRLKTEVDDLLGRVGLSKLAGRRMDEISEGARQLAQIASALVRQPELLLLDEPTSSLDYSHQLEIINLLSSLKRERGMTIVLVVHDLNLAARFADHIVMLHRGEIVAQGSPVEVINPANLASTFDILARVIEDPVGKTPLVIPIRQLP